MPNIIWSPQEKQAAFMSRPEYEALYGGAAGGGKSDSMLMEALRQVHIPHYRGIIFRKTYPMLTDLIDRSREIYKRAYPAADYNGSEHVWRFPSGSKIYFGNMQHVQDRINYQGKHYDFIGFDELTQFTWDEYSYMMSRNRPNGPGTRVYMRATANPGGVGHGWVKARFITAAPPMTPIKDVYEVFSPKGERLTFEASRIFVPASVFDNKKLLENDPMYLARLAAMPEAEKQALLYGSWDSFEGQVFTEWRNDPAHYADRKYTHVIDPFQVPPHWKIWRGFDFGYARPFAVGWFAINEAGQMYHIREYYGWDGTANHGAKMEVTQIAKEIRRIEQEDPLLRGREIHGVADPAIFSKNGQESIAGMMEKQRLYWFPGRNNRIDGKMQFHYRFAFGDDGEPMFQVFSTCKNFIRTIPNLVYDVKQVEDIDTTQEDHIYDMTRYVMMEHIIAPRAIRNPVPVGEDPLNQRQPARRYTVFTV